MKPSHLDTNTFIERLNEDLGTGYQSIVQYIRHIATIKGVGYRSIAEELDNHPSQEPSSPRVRLLIEVPDAPRNGHVGSGIRYCGHLAEGIGCVGKTAKSPSRALQLSQLS